MYSNAAILIAIALNVLALIYKFFPPKSINKLYGYHMKSSMRNEDTWREANTYAAKMMLMLSILFLIAALISSRFEDFGVRGLSIFAGIIVLACAGLYYLTEIHMKNVFDQNGNRK